MEHQTVWVTVRTFVPHPSGADAKPGMCSHQLRAELPSCGGWKSPPCRAASGKQQFRGCLNPTVKFKGAQSSHLSIQILLSKFFHRLLVFSLGAGGFPFPVFPYTGTLHFPFTNLSTARQQLIARHHVASLFTYGMKGLLTVPRVPYIVNWEKMEGSN